ncbi:MAG: 50S ribosomal protein L11 methyltransferase [Thermodesulfobacteriota bacterium]|nr:50S ribosomal protein L11 methyltransferase [Thermodesulfobacteriota bacterium]
MTETRYRLSRADNYLNIPYKDLYIYYLKGHLTSDSKFFYKDFIGNWEEDEFSFLFFSRPSKKKVEDLLHAQPQLTLLDHYHMTYDDWHGEKLAPFRAGRFFITHPWDKIGDNLDAGMNGLHITLDPGVVFGTGAHATTYNCLEALELVFSNSKVQSALDLGTGTGVLAIAAARLGCKKILAVDKNLLAARTAEKNVQLNNATEKVVVIQGSAEIFVDNHADLVIANIHFDVMKNLLNSEGFWSKKWFILSGLLHSQAEEAAYMLEQKGAKIIKNWERDGIWHTFFGNIC